MAAYEVSRLGEQHADRIVACFRSVYGDTYANELFYDAGKLAQALSSGRVRSVGALAADGALVGHMAMTVHPGALFVELGNTVVDPAARGAGLAWQIGAELSLWCRELGYCGFLHYPTTDHHIMQRHSVERGFETGLMLGYIPAGTSGQVGAAQPRGRQAATIVYEPYGPSEPMAVYAPERYVELLEELAAPTGLIRRWQTPRSESAPSGRAAVHRFVKRGLERLEIRRWGADLNATVSEFSVRPVSCLQIDFHLDDTAVGIGVESVLTRGFRFCGWLPGYRKTDVLRLQRLNERVTELSPRLENPVAQALLDRYREETG